jgi:hypothetical protein
MRSTKAFISFSILSILLLLLHSCTKEDGEGLIYEPNLSDNPTLKEVEAYVRYYEDRRAVFTYNDYETILKKLSETKFVVLPVNEMRDRNDNSKVVIGLRHDIDCHPFKALKLAELEEKYGFRATYYVLATAPYAGKFSDREYIRYRCMDEVYLKLHEKGSEIGIHNDLLTVMIDKGMNPFAFNKKELQYYKSLGIPIYGTAAHGSSIASITVPNYQVFADFAKNKFIKYGKNKYPLGEHSLKDFGYVYEAYFLNNNKDASDNGGKLSTGSKIESIIRYFEDSQPGDRIIFLTHPVWWGKE